MKKSQKKAIAVGAGVAALAAAAGVYMMTGKNAKNRKKVVAWAEGMQKDVVKELRKAKKGSQSAYNQVVDSVAKNYKAAKKVSAPELAMAATELKGHWDSIRKELEGASKTVRRITPKTTKSKAKKVTVRKVSAKKKSKKR